MSDRATLAFYERTAPRYTFSSGQAPSRDLDSFLDRLDPGARILELGCGAGRDAARMVERGFEIDATDGVAAMVRKANERFDVDARQMRSDELAVEKEYDAVWAHASLLHVSRVEVPGVLRSIRRALRPGGWHYASFKLGNREGRCDLGRLHNFPTPGWIYSRYRESGFSIENRRAWVGSGADGTVRDWIAITVRRLD